jgi:ATP-dependent Lon protease
MQKIGLFIKKEKENDLINNAIIHSMPNKPIFLYVNKDLIVIGNNLNKKRNESMSACENKDRDTEDTYIENTDVENTDVENTDVVNDKDENERPRRKIKRDNPKEIIAEMIYEMDEEDLSTQVHNYLKEFNWKHDLTEEDIQILEPLYDKICVDISTMPKISDILKLSIPYEEKCNIIEKILILNNAQPNTFEFLQLRHQLNKTVEKYKKFNMTEEQYKEYREIENKLICSEKKIKPLKYHILDADIPISNKIFLYERYRYFSTLDTSNSEYNKLRQWIDVALNIPTKLQPMKILSTDTSYKINKYLYNIRRMLDDEIYGMESVKEKILFLLNNRITNNNSKGLSFALCGPPGTAKTSIIHVLSKAIELPSFQINLGGAKDVSFLSGYGYTYEGSAPGVIVQALLSLKYKNGIIYFDEFDKISNTLHGTEISRMLLHITDFTQNDKFHDRYLSNSIDIDLSNIWFIYSLNDKEMLDRTLSDRIPIIMVDGYTKKEKFKIAQDYIIPKSLCNVSLNRNNIIFTDAAIEYIIDIAEKTEKSKHKSGVRQVKHLIDNILMKVNMLKTINSSKKNSKFKLKLSFDLPNFSLPLIVSREVIDLLKVDNSEEESISYQNMYM